MAKKKWKDVTVDSMYGGNQGMKYLITGGAGFIGSHLAEELLNRGNKVTIVDDMSTGKKKNISHLECKFKQFEFDMVDVLELGSLYDCDVVFHLAASVGVKLIIDKPLESIQNNISGTDHILKLASEHNAKVVFTSTSEVYGKGKAPFKEDDNLILGATTCSRWSYAASKIIDEFLCLAYAEKGLPVIVARLFNVVGSRQSGDYGMVLPRFVWAAHNRQALEIYGTGEQTRCFLHVLDAVEALILLSKNEEAVGEIVNVGSTIEVSIKGLARTVSAMFNIEEFIVFKSFKEIYCNGFEDMERRVPDTSKLKKLTGWTHRHSLEEAIEDVKREISGSDTALSA